MHGDKDPLVPMNQSELLAEALKKAGFEVGFHVVRGAGHGFTGEESFETVREAWTGIDYASCSTSDREPVAGDFSLLPAGPPGATPPPGRAMAQAFGSADHRKNGGDFEHL
jgi:hypothetical protein